MAPILFDPVRANDDALQTERDRHSDTLWLDDWLHKRTHCLRENRKPVIQGLVRVCREHGLNPLPLNNDLGPPPPDAPDAGTEGSGKRRRPLSMD
jgi:hypothetical protein